MKKSILVLLTFLSISILSCDPDVANEKVNLPDLDFGFSITPDTPYIKVGDTLTISTKIPSKLSNGIVLDDGKAVINFISGIYPSTPIFSLEGVRQAQYNNDFEYIENIGEVIIQPNTKQLFDIYGFPNGQDSIIIEFKYIPLKVGTYQFSIYSKFYEGSKGKTRTKPFFAMANHNFDKFWKLPNENILPGDYLYESSYLFAVY